MSNEFLNDIASFEEKVIPKNATDIQKKEMKKAFTAGAKVAANWVFTLHEDAGMDYLEEIEEYMEFLLDK